MAEVLGHVTKAPSDLTSAAEGGAWCCQTTDGPVFLLVGPQWVVSSDPPHRRSHCNIKKSCCNVNDNEAKLQPN